MSGIKTWLFSKSAGQVESFRLTHQALYNGTFKYSSYPLFFIAKCSYDGVSLRITGPKFNEEFLVKDAKLAARIQNHITKAKKEGKRLVEEMVKQLRSGIYFIAYEAQDEECSTRSTNTFSGKQSKIVWTDCSYLYISTSKASIKNMFKISLDAIRKVVLEEFDESSAYKITILLKEGHSISLYSNDFFKAREVITVLEYLSVRSHYVGRPQTGIGLVFRKALHILKAAKEVNDCSYKDLFLELKSAYKEPTELEIISEECNDLNDTKELPSQISSSVNPQDLVKDCKGKLKRQLSIYPERESFSEDQRNRSCSALGLFQAKLSPIKNLTRMKKSMSRIITPKTKFVESCSGDYIDDTIEAKNAHNDSYIKVIDDSKLFPDHSFSMDRCIEAPLPLLKQSSEHEAPMETARFTRQQFAGTGRTEPEFGHALRVGEAEAVGKCAQLRERAKQYKAVIQEQNVKLERLVGKYEVQEEKLLALEVVCVDTG